MRSEKAAVSGPPFAILVVQLRLDGRAWHCTGTVGRDGDSVPIRYCLTNSTCDRAGSIGIMLSQMDLNKPGNGIRPAGKLNSDMNR